MSDERPRILIVDDTPSNLQTMGEVLRIGGKYRISLASNGQEALDLAQRIHPDLILLDVMMPGISGYEVCQKLKQNPDTEDIPVIFVTARAETADVVEGLSYGAADYITKPIIPAILLARAQTHLALHFQAQHLKAMSNTDALTALHNRKAFDTFLRSAIHNGEPLALLFIDLDRFKPVNDELGHRVGDLLLQQVADRLRSLTRQMDFAARVGGDEFALLVQGYRSREDVILVADKLVLSLGLPFEVEGNRLQIGASVGAAFYPTDASDVKGLYQAADTAMYYAKNTGRSQFRLFEPWMAEQASDRLRLEADLMRGLQHDEFFFQYLPTVSLSSGAVLRLEALLRWRHPERGEVQPGAFIQILTQGQLGIQAFEWSLRAVIRRVARWHAAGLGRAAITLNLSRREFRNIRLPDQISEALAAEGCDPGLARFIELDVPEDLLMTDLAFSQKQIGALAALGVQVSLDNFGSGQFSLQALAALPLASVKLSRSLVAGVGSADGERVLLTALTLIRSLGHEPVCVGIENQAQLDFLRAQGCDAVEGFHVCGLLNEDAAGLRMSA